MATNLINGIEQLHTLLYMPYQALQIIGYRLVGKRCQYAWGRSIVKPIGPASHKQQLVGLLLPVTTFWLVLILELGLVTYVLLHFHLYLPWLILPLIVLAVLPLSPYFCQVLFDSWRIYRLLKK